MDCKRTYQEVGDVEARKYSNKVGKKVWILNPKSDLDKRVCTVMACLRPIGTNPKLGIIFRGTGT